MTIDKITSAPTPNEQINKINEIIDNLGSGGTATDVKVNGTSITSNGVANIVTNTAYNSSTNKIATMSDVPTKTSELTNDSGYTTNKGTVTSVNNVSPVNGNVTLSIPAAQVQANWNETNSSSKAYIQNKPSLTEVKVVVDSYSNGSSWYRKYSDGWCEQGGVVQTGAVTSYVISFLVEMRDTNYTALISNMWLGDDTGGVADQYLIAGASSYGKSTTTLRISTINNANYALNWQVCGYMY